MIIEGAAYLRARINENCREIIHLYKWQLYDSLYYVPPIFLEV